MENGKKNKNNYLSKYKQNNLLIENLLKSYNQIGFSMKVTHSNSLNYIYNKRFKQTIINLNKTLVSLQNVFQFLQFFYKKKGGQKLKSIFFIFETDNLDLFINNINEENETIPIKYNKGFFSNNNNKNINLIILLTSKKNESIINEARKQNIPIISLIDTNENPDIITFPILTNKQNIKSIFFIFYLFKKFLKQNILLTNYETSKIKI